MKIKLKKIKTATIIFLLTFSLNVVAQESKNSNDLASFLEKKNYTQIKLSKLLTGHLSLSAKVNGIPATFILDTGAGGTVLETKQAQKFGLISANTNNKAAGAGGGDMELQATSIKSFVLDSYRLVDFTVYLMDLEHVNGALRQLGISEVDGVIGADILSQGKAIIDYSNMLLYLIND